MRAALEVFARRWWAGDLGLAGQGLTAVATPLSWVWAALAASAGRRAAAAATRVDGLTVVSIGNLAVGGTGKTPVVGWVAERLSEDGARTAVLVGGHAPDEASLLRGRLPGVRVLSGRDRPAAAEEAAAAGAEVALLDDGCQHRRLARQLDVVLLSAEDRFPGSVLPAGPYRERSSALRRADVVLVTRRSATPGQSRAVAARAEEFAEGRVVGGIELAVSTWSDLDGRQATPPDGPVLAVCGVARPEAFGASVAREVAGTVELVAFADHHVYTPADIARVARRAGGRPIVTTEKDAVKLHGFVDRLGTSYVVREAVRWDWGEEDFLARLRAAAAAPWR